MKKLKILELTNFTAGVCGVWTRVSQESQELSKKGCEVKIFSSNLTKGSEKIALPKEKIGRVEIHRFPAKKLGGESFMYWNFEKEALSFHPDIIIAHSYRHLHTLKALKIAKKINAKVFLVTHAPFSEDNKERSFLQSIVVKLYDFFIGVRTLRKFDKVIAISKWENSFLDKLKLDKSKRVYIPNGIPEEFFRSKNKKKNQKILFFGRVSPVKNLETLIKAISLTSASLDIIGPAEEAYKKQLLSLIKKLNLESRIKFLPPIYNINEKVKILSSYPIFILPSIREGMPQALIELMALNCLVIASKTKGAEEIIENGKNGFLFDIGDEKGLADELVFSSNKGNSALIRRIAENGKKKAEEFNWKKIINRLTSLF